MDLFDTHAHLADEQLAADVVAVVERAAATGVTRILSVGTTAASSRECLGIAQKFSSVLASVGIHPNHAAEAQPGDLSLIHI